MPRKFFNTPFNMQNVGEMAGLISGRFDFTPPVIYGLYGAYNTREVLSVYREECL